MEITHSLFYSATNLALFNIIISSCFHLHIINNFNIFTLYLCNVRLFFLLACFFFWALSPKCQSSFPFNVMIDAGHGGKDSGTCGAHSKEKDIVLDIAKMLQSKSNQDINILLTRTNDVFIKLEERSKLANAQHSDLFISLHCNHIHLPKINGTEIYVFGQSYEKEHQHIVDRENGGFYIENSQSEDLSFILGEIEDSAYLNASIQYGNIVTTTLENNSSLKQRGLRQANFRVLKHLEMPGVLIEIAYLSNPENEKYINSALGKEEIAEALWQTIVQYLSTNQELNPSLSINSNK